ncbi:MAG: VOC family protein [Kofleriaceae bacterium]
MHITEEDPMPEAPMPVTGTFCWTELHTTDPNNARGFYGELLGWKLEDMPMPQGSYTMASVNGKHVAGLTKTSEEAAKMGAPPTWQSYIAVDDVKASASKAAELGGKVLVGATQMGPGTFAVIQDPTGAVFLLWHTTTPMGTFLYGEPGAMNWNELITTDVVAAQAFYTKLFGWTAEATPGMDYTVFQQGDRQIGGLMSQPDEMKGAPSMWGVYFAVDDVDASITKATKLGATILAPVMDVPNVGRFAWLSDVQGAPFAVMTNASK